MIVPIADHYVVCSRATLLDDGAGQMRAWVERHVRTDPDIRWILGNYVEADEPNSNGHTFPLNELLATQHTLAGKPLNMLHREHYIVGAFAGAQLVHGNGAEYVEGDDALEAAADGQPPYVEALAGLWHNRFPEEFFQIRRAHQDGTLFFSMEAIPESVSCPTCAHAAVYAGYESDTYCDHMQGSVGPKVLHNPTFNGGAIIIPPVRPGWNRADITAISSLLQETPEAEAVYAEVAALAPDLTPHDWEATMAQLVMLARQFDTSKRKDMADKGKAMPDGAFPIANEKDLRNAIRAVGRAKNPAAAKAHIKKRAKALNLSYLVPKDW